MERILFERFWLDHENQRQMAFPTCQYAIFGMLRHIVRLYRWYSKERIVALKAKMLDTKRELGKTTKILYMDIYNRDAQRLINDLKDRMRSKEKQTAKGTVIKSRMKWKQVGDKCTRQFFQAIRKKTLIL